MNAIDSSAWLEYLADGPNADFFAAAIEDPDNQIVPSLTIYEVAKRILQQRGEDETLTAVALMQQGTVVDLTGALALEAARLGAHEALPLADSIILATARSRDAVLWTQDVDFKGKAGVKYRPAR